MLVEYANATIHRLHRQLVLDPTNQALRGVHAISMSVCVEIRASLGLQLPTVPVSPVLREKAIPTMKMETLVLIVQAAPTALETGEPASRTPLALLDSSMMVMQQEMAHARYSVRTTNGET